MAPLAAQITDAADRVKQLGNDYDTRFIDTRREYADAAVDGVVYFRHLGEKPVTVGRRGIDWSGGHVQHQEWCAQLNRLFHLSPLVDAWTTTGDERYALAARDYMEDWLDQHPGTDGEWKLSPGDNTLTLSIRQHMWMGRLADFTTADCFDEAFLQRLLDAVTVQLNFLGRNIADHMNWRIAHADSLLLNGMRLDFLPESAAWRDQGVRVINDAFQRQILPDGVHAERNPGYHGWMTRVFSRYLDMSSQRPELGLRIDRDRVAAMYDYVVATTRPNGALCALHDSKGVCDGARSAGWDAPRRTFRERHGLDPALPEPVQLFPDAGQFFLRTDWSEAAEYWTFDASTWGGGHCHLSRNAVQLHAGGRSILVDPGTLSYEKTDPLTFYGKSTRAHNTLTINGLNQVETDPTTRIERADDLVMLISEYAGGYWPGRYNWSFDQGYGDGLQGTHHRSLFWVPGRYGLVIDHIVHDPTPEGLTIEANWQLGTGCTATLVGNHGADITAPGTGATMRFALGGEAAVLSQHSGEMDPPRGWLPGDGQYDASPQLSLQFPQSTIWGHSLATVIAPHGPDGAARFEITEAISPDVAGYGKIVISWANGERDTLHWIGRYYKSLDGCDGLQTDASLVWRSESAEGTHLRGFALDCTYLLPELAASRTQAQAIAF